jgi:hypothetical protein
MICPQFAAILVLFFMMVLCFGGIIIFLIWKSRAPPALCPNCHKNSYV